MVHAFVGIDVAFAKGKRLPVVVSCWENHRLKPIPLRKFTDHKPPAGQGNAASIAPKTLIDFVEAAALYLKAIEQKFRIGICRIAIDSPSDPKPSKVSRRSSELELDCRRVSCFATPSEKEFDVIRDKVRDHLARGGSESQIPHANQLWMLVGFELFKRLRREWECIEVYPQAIVCVLGAGARHKRHQDGLDAQFKACARYTGWTDKEDMSCLQDAAFGSKHDRFDAYLASWVAALNENEREPIGVPPSDAIWVPKLPLKAGRQ